VKSCWKQYSSEVNSSLPAPVEIAKMFPIINSDCFEDHDTISTSNFCALLAVPCDDTGGINETMICAVEECPRNHGETVMSFEIRHGKVTPILVGLSSAKNQCDMDKPLVFTRISMYRDWIEELVNFSEKNIFLG
jgi:hypothetical protein